MNLDRLLRTRRRHGLAAILSAIILMAMIATVLVAFFIFVTNGDLLGT